MGVSPTVNKLINRNAVTRRLESLRESKTSFTLKEMQKIIIAELKEDNPSNNTPLFFPYCETANAYLKEHSRKAEELWDQAFSEDEIDFFYGLSHAIYLKNKTLNEDRASVNEVPETCLYNLLNTMTSMIYSSNKSSKLSSDTLDTNTPSSSLAVNTTSVLATKPSPLGQTIRAAFVPAISDQKLNTPVNSHVSSATESEPPISSDSKDELFEFFKENFGDKTQRPPVAPLIMACLFPPDKFPQINENSSLEYIWSLATDEVRSRVQKVKDNPPPQSKIVLVNSSYRLQ